LSGPLARIRSPRLLTAGVIRTEATLAARERKAENAAMSTVGKDIRSLSVTDRLQLLEEIWDSLAETPEAIPVTDAQRKELARRRRAHARNPSAAKSWAEVRARLRRRK
jgi:putative addiction module component (TIGR02574 family)